MRHAGIERNAADYKESAILSSGTKVSLFWQSSFPVKRRAMTCSQILGPRGVVSQESPMRPRTDFSFQTSYGKPLTADPSTTWV